MHTRKLVLQGTPDSVQTSEAEGILAKVGTPATAKTTTAAGAQGLLTAATAELKTTAEAPGTSRNPSNNSRDASSCRGHQ
jgi:hypothetical protein